MLAQFLLENLRFGINLGAALVFFAVFWLYLDSWLEKKELKVFLRFIGFLLMAISFLATSTQIESTLIEIPAAFEKIRNWVDFTFMTTRIAGYLFIILSLFLDPILPRPKIK